MIITVQNINFEEFKGTFLTCITHSRVSVATSITLNTQTSNATMAIHTS